LPGRFREQNEELRGSVVTSRASTIGTLVIGREEGQPRSLARLRARRRAYGIAAECELLTDELSRLEHRNWSDLFGRVLLVSRRLIALLAPGGDDDTLFDEQLKPKGRLADTHGELVAAVQSITIGGSSGFDNETVARAVQAIRSLATNLFVAEEVLASPKEERKKPVPTTVSERRSRVLVTDDDPGILRILQRTLEGWGLEVLTAGNGQKALDVVAADDAIDLILTDIEMPVLDGVALLEQLKANPDKRSIPVIVVSSKDDMGSVSRCIELGAEDHISKPFAPQILNARVRASLDRKRLHDAETDALRRVGEIITAAEAVEVGEYTPGALSGVAATHDGLGKLARVFERMVSTLKSKEERLRRRLLRLRSEVSESQVGSAVRFDVDDDALKVGDVVSGRFEIIDRLGQGGMGAVYHARDRELKEDVALKIVRRDVLDKDPLILERLKSEIRLARKLSHPNIVRSHDLGEWNGRYFITMEKVQGVTVADLLDRRGRLTLESTLAIGTQLCDALAVAHAADIIHRDIKPANLLVDEAGVLKVMDFGIARQMGSATGVQTGSGFVIGTPPYMAPELLMGGKPDPSTDLFAVGVVLYECLTGRLPHDGESPMSLFASILDAEAKPVQQFSAEAIPEALASLIHTQLRFDAKSRVTSARELGQRLGEFDHVPA
jgi:CheY-like chemotaxis protein